MNKYKSLLGDTLLFAVSNFGSKFLTILLVPLYTSVLTTAEYGISDLITTTVNLIYPILTLAISEAVLRYGMEKNTNSEQVFMNSFFVVAMSTFLLVCFKPLSKFILPEISKYWWYFVTIYFFYNFHSCLAAYIKAVDKTKVFAVQGITQTLFVIISNILLLVVFKAGLNGYLISIIIGYVAAILLMLFMGDLFSIFKSIRFDKILFKDMIKYSLPMIPTLLAWWINTSSNKYMIMAFLGLSASGIYSVANKIPTIVSTISTIFNQAWQLAAIKSRGDKDESNFYTEVYSALMLISLYVCVVAVPCCKMLAGFLFAKDFFVAWKASPFLLISTMFSLLAGFMASAFRAAKKTKSLLWSVLLGAAINIILNFVLIQLLGIVGATIATMTSFMFIWLQRVVSVQKIVRVKINMLRSMSTYFILIAATSLIVFEVRYSYYFYGVLALCMVAMNYKDTKRLIAHSCNSLIKSLNQKSN